MKKFIMAVALCFVWVAGSAGVGNTSGLEKKLEPMLKYLKKVPAVDWVVIEDNHVYIGWKNLPENFNIINRSAAAIGSKSANAKIHLWSVRFFLKGWRPGKGKYICKTVGEHGKVTNSNCKL